MAENIAPHEPAPPGAEAKYRKQLETLIAANQVHRESASGVGMSANEEAISAIARLATKVNYAKSDSDNDLFKLIMACDSLLGRVQSIHEAIKKEHAKSKA